MRASLLLKKNFQRSLIFLAFSTNSMSHGLSLQKNLLINKKTIDFQKKTGLLASSPIRIDKNSFEKLADTYYLKGEVAFFERNNGLALSHLKKALIFAPHSLHLQKRIAQIYEQEGLLAEALSHYQQLAQKTEDNKDFLQKITQIYALNGLNTQALENHEELLKQEPNSFALHFEKALLMIQKKSWTRSLSVLKTAKKLANSPQEKAQVLLSQSFLFLKLKKWKESEQSLNELSNLPLEDTGLILKIADFYKSLGQKTQAFHFLKKLQKTQGEELVISKALLDYYISEGRWNKAKQELEEIQISGQMEPQHYFYTALLLIDKENYDKALSFLKDLLMKEPKQGQYLYLIGGIYEKKEEWEKALQSYRKVPETSSHFVSAQIQSAQVLKQMGDKEQALVLLKKMSSPYGGKSFQALLLYAEFLWNEGDKQSALMALTEGLKLQSKHTELLFLRGFYHQKLGQTDLALQDMNNILQIQENHEEALNFTAVLYSEQKIHLNKAEKMARKALSLKPHSSYFLNTLGWILFQKSNFKSALHYLKKAFLRNKKDSHIANRLGKVYLKLKDFKNSEFFFKEALRIEEDDKKSKTIQISKQVRN